MQAADLDGERILTRIIKTGASFSSSGRRRNVLVRAGSSCSWPSAGGACRRPAKIAVTARRLRRRAAASAPSAASPRRTQRAVGAARSAASIANSALAARTATERTATSGSRDDSQQSAWSSTKKVHGRQFVLSVRVPRCTSATSSSPRSRFSERARYKDCIRRAARRARNAATRPRTSSVGSAVSRNSLTTALSSGGRDGGGDGAVSRQSGGASTGRVWCSRTAR